MKSSKTYAGCLLQLDPTNSCVNMNNAFKWMTVRRTMRDLETPEVRSFRGDYMHQSVEVLTTSHQLSKGPGDCHS